MPKKNIDVQPKTDGSGNIYFDLGFKNKLPVARITAIEATYWGCPGVRIQAYRNPSSNDSLHEGPEIPFSIENGKEEAFNFLTAFNKCLDVLGINLQREEFGAWATKRQSRAAMKRRDKLKKIFARMSSKAPRADNLARLRGLKKDLDEASEIINSLIKEDEQLWDKYWDQTDPWQARRGLSGEDQGTGMQINEVQKSLEQADKDPGVMHKIARDIAYTIHDGDITDEDLQTIQSELCKRCRSKESGGWWDNNHYTPKGNYWDGFVSALATILVSYSSKRSHERALKLGKIRRPAGDASFRRLREQEV